MSFLPAPIQIKYTYSGETYTEPSTIRHYSLTKEQVDLANAGKLKFNFNLVNTEEKKTTITPEAERLAKEAREFREMEERKRSELLEDKMKHLAKSIKNIRKDVRRLKNKQHVKEYTEKLREVIKKDAVENE